MIFVHNARSSPVAYNRAIGTYDGPQQSGTLSRHAGLEQHVSDETGAISVTRADPGFTKSETEAPRLEKSNLAADFDPPPHFDAMLML